MRNEQVGLVHVCFAIVHRVSGQRSVDDSDIDHNTKLHTVGLQNAYSASCLNVYDNEPIEPVNT